MSLIGALQKRWEDLDHPFLVHENGSLFFQDLCEKDTSVLNGISPGEVVALIGDFDPSSISLLIELIERGVVLVPLSSATRAQHDYFFESAFVDVVVEGAEVRRLHNNRKHPLLDHLRSKEHGGLVLFSTGTTGRPKAILHDLTVFMKRFETPRPTLKTLNFLLFDHIGGLNTLLHTLFNGGTVVSPATRTVEAILETCAEYEVEVLPTTPTFLRMMLMSGLVPDSVPTSLRVITYGTERMDQFTLDSLCGLLPNVDFRQTFGLSELGLLRVKSEARDSLFMKVGGEGVETRVVGDILEIRSVSRMLGYLNAELPFDDLGWYRTNDVVEQRGEFFRVTGRSSDVINVGGLKFMASEVELAALQLDGVKLASAYGRDNPITGQHVELLIELRDGSNLDAKAVKNLIGKVLAPHMVPRRVAIDKISVGHRFKKS